MAEMRDFEEHFRRADQDKDGKISYDEALAFFGLEVEVVVEEIWMHTNQERTSLLSRGEFMHGLRLVTTAQKERSFVPNKAMGGAGDNHTPEENIALAQALMNLSASLAPQESGNDLSKKITCGEVILSEAQAMHERSHSDLLIELEKRESVLKKLELDERLMRSDCEQKVKNLEDLLQKREHENSERLKKSNDHITLLERRFSELKNRYDLLQSKCDERDIKYNRLLHENCKPGRLLEKRSLAVAEAEELRQRRNQDLKYNRVLKERDIAVAEAEKLRQKIDQDHNYDRLLEERDLAVAEAGALRRKRDQMLAVLVTAMHREFSSSALEDATEHYSPSRILGNGAFGVVYRGDLRGLTVAVKVLRHHNLQNRSQFEQEAITLSMVRHPNLIALLGACAESYTLVYEFMPGGTLEDFLKSPSKRQILTWQIRIRIIAEICSALIFLHENEPHPIAHGDIKAENILLDANLISKLSDFGLAHVLNQYGRNNTNLYQTGHPAGTIGYMDPEYSTDGVLTCRSDVYSFGVLILRLLTAIPLIDEKNVHIRAPVLEAWQQGNLRSIVDTEAGRWPSGHISMLASIAFRCTSMRRKKRPDLSGKLWEAIEAMRDGKELPSHHMRGQ